MEQQPLHEGALQWIRRLAGKRAVWVGVQTAHVLCPLRKVVTGRGFFLSDAPLRTMPPNKKAPDITPEASSSSLARFLSPTS
jgi:hypothetical protein